MNLGRNDKKTKRLQLLEKVAATIAKNGLLRSKSLMGIFLIGSDDGAFLRIYSSSSEDILL